MAGHGPEDHQQAESQDGGLDSSADRAEPKRDEGVLLSHALQSSARIAGHWRDDGQGSADNASWNRPALRPGHIWSYDFVKELTRSGGPIRILNVVDEFTRVSLGSHVARSIGARDVGRHLERLFSLLPTTGPYPLSPSRRQPTSRTSDHPRRAPSARTGIDRAPGIPRTEGGLERTPCGRGR